MNYPMLNLSHIRITGFVGKDAEHRVLSNGIAVANFSLAHTVQNKDKEKVTTWFTVQGYDKVAESVGRVRKGQMVYVEGKLEHKQGKDGKTYPTITASSLGVLLFEKREGDKQPLEEKKQLLAVYNPEELADIPF